MPENDAPEKHSDTEPGESGRMINDLKYRLIERGWKTERIVWIIIIIGSILYSIIDYTDDNYNQSLLGFIQACVRRGYWFFPISLTLFLSLFTSLFGTYPISTFVRLTLRPRPRHSSDHYSEIAGTEVPEILVSGNPNSTSASADTTLSFQPKTKPEDTFRNSEKIVEKRTLLTYLEAITLRSQRVAKDAIVRVNLHLLGGVFIGVIGVVFFSYQILLIDF